MPEQAVDRHDDRAQPVQAGVGLVAAGDPVGHLHRVQAGASRSRRRGTARRPCSPACPRPPRRRGRTRGTGGRRCACAAAGTAPRRRPAPGPSRPTGPGGSARRPPSRSRRCRACRSGRRRPAGWTASRSRGGRSSPRRGRRGPPRASPRPRAYVVSTGSPSTGKIVGVGAVGVAVPGDDPRALAGVGRGEVLADDRVEQGRLAGLDLARRWRAGSVLRAASTTSVSAAAAVGAGRRRPGRPRPAR